MKTIKKITLTLFSTFLISVSGQLNAKSFIATNNTEENYFITSLYKSRDSFGKIFYANDSIEISDIYKYTPIGEAEGPAHITYLKEIYIYESGKDVKYDEKGKFTNYIDRIIIDDEIPLYLTQLDTGTIVIEAIED